MTISLTAGVAKGKDTKLEVIDREITLSGELDAAVRARLMRSRINARCTGR